MKSKPIILCFLLTAFFSINSLGQDDSLFVTHEYIGHHVDPTDSLVSFKELHLTFHNVDTMEFTTYYIEVIEDATNRVISRKKLSISQNTLEMEITNGNVSVMIGLYPPDIDYRVLSRLVNYQGIESKIFTNNVSLDD